MRRANQQNARCVCRSFCITWKRRKRRSFPVWIIQKLRSLCHSASALIKRYGTHDAIRAHFLLPCKLFTSRSALPSAPALGLPTFGYAAEIVAIYILCKCLCTVCVRLRARIPSHLTVKKRAVGARPTPPLISNRQFSLFGSDFFLLLSFPVGFAIQRLRLVTSVDGYACGTVSCCTF